MTAEECLLAERALRRHGYSYLYRVPSAQNEWTILARKLPPGTPLGLREQPIAIATPEALAALLARLAQGHGAP